MTKNTYIQIKVAKDFGVYPGARYRTDGPFSGQEFYEDILKPKFQKAWTDSQKIVFIDLDGTFGYASSFISEIFIRLVKDFEDKKAIIKKLEFKSEDEPLLKKSIIQIINEA